VLRTLPERYVAAKFYGNIALPPTPDNGAFVSSYLTDLAQQIDVCCSIRRSSSTITSTSREPARAAALDRTSDDAREQPAIQSEVIRGARGFVGTYGGFSYLAPLCGTNTLAFYSHAADSVSIISRSPSACSPRCGAARSPSSICARPTCCVSALAGRFAVGASR
jgi:hypothetical protein